MDNKFEAPHKLSDVQTQTLLLIFISPAPKVALGSVQSNDKTAAAATVLMQLGLISQDGDGVVVTEKGIAMLDALNVVDKTGKRTPYGEEEFAKIAQMTSRVGEGHWPLISSISQRV